MSEPPLPSRVDVGALMYRVTDEPNEINRLCRDHKVDLLGNQDSRTLTLAIEPVQASGLKRDTLLHEVLHAVFEVCGLADEWDKERHEAVVTRLTPWLLDTLRRNPDLVAFLLAE